MAFGIYSEALSFVKAKSRPIHFWKNRDYLVYFTHPNALRAPALKAEQVLEEAHHEINSALSTIADIVSLESETEKQAFTFLEKHIREIGCKIEKLALAEMGVLDNEIMDTMYATLYIRYFLKQKMSFNYPLLKEKTLDLQNKNERELSRLSSLGEEEKMEEIKWCKFRLSVCEDILRLLQNHKPQQEASFELKYSVSFVFNSMMPLYNFHEESSSILRRNYLFVLSQIRDYGGNLDAHSYHSTFKNKDAKSKENSHAIKKEESALEDLKRIATSLPSTWIDASNTSNPLFLKTLYAHDKAKYSSIPKSDGGAGGYYSHDEGEGGPIPLKHSEIGSYYDFSDKMLTHEIGHRLVRLFPIIGELEEVFYLRRTTNSDGTRSKQIEGTDRRETNFIFDHSGTDPAIRRERIIQESLKYKIGKWRRAQIKSWKTAWTDEELKEAYEVFSTGLESILTGSEGCLSGLRSEYEENRIFPWGKFVVEDDPELRHFVLGILATI